MVCVGPHHKLSNFSDSYLDSQDRGKLSIGQETFSCCTEHSSTVTDSFHNHQEHKTQNKETKALPQLSTKLKRKKEKKTKTTQKIFPWWKTAAYS